jgi:hypothetical protein
MKSRLVYQSLDTSFVNLAALVSHLQRSKFKGAVRVKLKDYEAEILFDESKRIRTRERDRLSGRISEGEKALQSLLIRARESGGRIDVFQFAKEAKNGNGIYSSAKAKSGPAITAKSAMAEGSAISRKVNEEIASKLAEAQRTLLPRVSPAPRVEPQKASENTKTEKVKRPRSAELTEAEWETVLKLTCEILAVVDKSFQRAGHNFTPVFTEIRRAISADYPFMNPNKPVFNFNGRSLRLSQKINANLLAASVNEVLRRLLSGLTLNEKSSALRRDILMALGKLTERRRAQYERYNFLPQIERNIQR